MSSLVDRSELLATYARPYRRWMPVILRGYGVHRVTAVAVLFALVGAILELTTDQGDGILAFGLAAAALAVVYTIWVVANGALLVRKRTEEWRGAGGELSRVRARRPHAGDADPHVAHDEYAVAVSDDGRLVTFAFTPLAASEAAAQEAILITGTPRYEALEVAANHFDPVDAARAAEQLAEAQEHAARLEAAAITRAYEELDGNAAARELLNEARSTGAALRDITGHD